MAVPEVERPRAAVYVRVSTQEQKKGYSLQGQYRDCRAYTDRHGYRVVRSFRDVASGRTLERPGFQALVESALRREWQILVIWRRDRFGRDSVHNGVLDRLLAEHGVRIESVQTGPREVSSYTRFMDRIFDAVDELDAEKILERCQMGRENAARAGVWPTVPPHGYRRTRRKGPLEPIPEKHPHVVRLYEMVAEGASLRFVAKDLGVDHSTLVYRVRNPCYKGTAVYNGIEVQVPPIVSEDLWQNANDRLDRAARSRGHTPTVARSRRK